MTMTGTPHATTPGVGPRSGWRGVWREPLLHFLLLGSLLFVLFNWWGSGAAGGNRIVVTPGQVDSMFAGFTRTWQRPPTDEELKGLVDDYVREELATREAMALGLDRDDTIIRRRLRQKLEFAAEDTIDSVPPTDAELQSWLDAHAASYRAEASVSFRQVYLSPERRGDAVDADAGKIVAGLAASGPDAPTDGLGDPLMLPSDVERTSRSEVARQFGDEFANAILEVAPGRWAGPVRSGFGVHVVLVRERTDSRALALADVRPLVERDFLFERRKQRLDAMYEGMLRRFRVVIEPRKASPDGASAPPTPTGDGK